MIEFIEEGHIYLKDGIIVPSVSEILHHIFPDKYKGIPNWVMEKKAEYGTKVHYSIECLELGKELPKLNIFQELSLKEYLEIKKINKIEVLEQETIVSYEYEYAGRLDMIAMVDGKFSLIDIKTTAVLDRESLSWQLSLYELAYGKKFSSLYCLWLPKGKIGKLVKIERKTKKEILKKLGEIKNGKI